MKKGFLPIVFMLLAFYGLLLSCDNAHTYRVGRPLIGTLINLTIVSDSEAKAAEAAEAVFEEISRIESSFSPFRKESDVYRVNAYGGSRTARVSDEMIMLIERAIGVSKATGGAFDVTYATLSSLWRIGSDPFVPPSMKSVRKRMSHMGTDKIVISKMKKTVRFRKAKTRIGLGGIAKGYAILRAIGILRAHGITDGIVDAGGDVQVIGTRQGVLWHVGLVHPRTKNIIAVLSMKSGQAVATSGDYERFSIYRGKRYHHIIDPKTGYPADSMVSVSVICSDPIEADALATGLFVMGSEHAREFLAKRKDIHAILIDKTMKISVSKELKGHIRFNEDLHIDWI